MLIQLAPSSERILKKICKALYIFRSVPRRARLRKPACVVPGFAVPCLFKLSTAMAPVVLRYGFSKITWPEDHFRRKALENGAKLCKAKYVYDVEETVSCRDSDSQVAAKCHSQVHQASYDVTLQVSEHLMLDRLLPRVPVLFLYGACSCVK